MGLLETIGIGKKKGAAGRPGSPAPSRPSSPSSGKKGRKDKATGPAAPLHDRRRRLVAAHDSMLKDLGGLLLEMYKRNRFREELLLDKCEESLAIEVEIAHVDQRLFQLGPTTVAGQRPIGRCECGAPVLPGQNFCGVCGRSFTTLTQSRTCERCSAGLRIGDAFCWSCGTTAPDRFAVIGSPNVSGNETTIDNTTATPSLAADGGPGLAGINDASGGFATPDATQIIEVPKGASTPQVDAARQARESLPADLAAPPTTPPSAPTAASEPPSAPAGAAAASPAADPDAEKKRLEKIKKARAKELKARAKQRAKEARSSRKKGGG